ncbi:MAG: LamG domain-containing protein [Phycisphaerales bacterium]|nr:MAG: LamG domain-containing protein [Phycisphaerales bacterium]
MKPADRLLKLMRQSDVETTAEMDDRILGDGLKHLAKLKRTQPAGIGRRTGRIIMKSPFMKLAAAAVAVAAVLLGLNIIGPGGGGDALADVLERIEEVKTFTYRMKMKMANVPGMPTNTPVDAEMHAVVAKDIGMYMATYVDDTLRMKTYVVPDKKAIISVVPAFKQYTRVTLTDEVLTKIQKENGDPRAIVRQLKENEYTELGRSVVDGIEVEGFESADPNIVEKALGDVVGRIWVDVDTKLPVRFEVIVLAEDGEEAMHTTCFDYEWNVQVEPGVFDAAVPADYKLVADLNLSEQEQFHLEVLGMFGELTGGTYPSDLKVTTIMEEFQAAMITNFGHPMTEQLQSETIQKLMDLQMAGAYYTRLAWEAREMAYHGERVTADFPHAVLMRWKARDGVYKAVFGDLSVREVTPEELARLEAAPLNPKATAIKAEPADGAEGTVLTGLKLNWMPGAYSIAHRVYFGADPARMTLLGEVTTEHAEPGTLQRATTYYWRIDEVRSDRSVASGETWSFNTGRLVAHWKLDEGAGETVSNAAGTEYDGKIMGDPTWTKGMVGGALEFDSDGDYIEIVDSNDLAIRNQITVCAWIRTDKIARRWQAIATKGDRSWRLQGRRSGNALEFCCSGLIVPENRWGSLYGKTDVDDGRWHHVAGVYDGERIYLYIDGRVDNSKPAPGKIRLDDRTVLIGNNSQHPDRFWNGVIDDVRIYSYGLSAEEVAALAK